MEDLEILIVDDEPDILASVKGYLTYSGYKVTAVGSGRDAVEQIKKKDYCIVITDLKMQGFSGLDLLSAVKEQQPETEVVMLTGYGTIDSAVQALKFGCYDYIQKPFQLERLKALVDRIIEEKKLRWENMFLKRKLEEKFKYGDLVGLSVKMQEIYETIDRISDTNSTVLIQGESGTGKELVAKVIHQHSNRKHMPFVAVNCGAMPAGLMESELFGHVKGAFSGAIRDKIGLFKAADNGTIFLDEVLEISPPLQVTLLRVLQEKKLRPVGGTTEFDVDARVIAATNGNPEKAIQEGALREDLFYRLDFLRIIVPPLRERKEDLPILANHFLHKYSAWGKGKVKCISHEAMETMLTYDWPGNIRQLENVIGRALVLGNAEVISAGDLPPEITRRTETTIKNGTTYNLTESEYILIERALRKTGNNKVEAAKLLGINTATLYRKLKKCKTPDNDLQNASH